MQIISGGQTGVDVAALKAAKSLGITTGGKMPRNFRDENGNQYHYKEEYKMTQHSSTRWLPRTRWNVRESDGTVILCMDCNSSGSLSTMKACKEYERPHILISLSERGWDGAVSDIIEFVIEEDINTLNVAGNRESRAPGIEKEAYENLKKAFKAVLDMR